MEVIKVAETLNKFVAAVLTKEDERQMPAADIHFPEERDEMPQEIRGMPKQRIKKPEPPQTAQAAVTCEPAPAPRREVREINMQRRDAEPCVQEGPAGWSYTDTYLQWAGNLYLL